MFITALFTIAKVWNELRCPITDEWEKNKGKNINMYICIHT
jgi:hypothetical protein